MTKAPNSPTETNAQQPAVVTGVQLMKGIGHAPAKGFWADAWGTVSKRPGAIFGMSWIAILAVFACFSPLIASGHPLILREIDAAGVVTKVSYPLFRFLTALDIVLILLGTSVIFAVFLPLGTREKRLRWVAGIGCSALVVIVISSLVYSLMFGVNPPQWLRDLRGNTAAPFVAGGVGVFAAVVLGVLLPVGRGLSHRMLATGIACVIAVSCVVMTWNRPQLERFDYVQREMRGSVQATYTIIPFSPQQRFSELSRIEPGSTLGQSLQMDKAARGYDRVFVLGTDAFGSDVLSQVLHACRLSVSIGLVSTGIALMIGVTLGALMGYFGGWVDLVLYRVVEVFMSVPVLFLLIVTASILPPNLRSTYVMMAIIGCFSWMGMARFTRAEFLKLRKQDFVQSAQAVGLPLPAILFRHMLPNGVAPVLVDTSFAIAAAITVEAVLSYLNLGPTDQASWGRLLSGAVSAEGEFKWWLAVFPGVAIFLSVLSYNLIGEAFRDAIDPKLKKARV